MAATLLFPLLAIAAPKKDEATGEGRIAQDMPAIPARLLDGIARYHATEGAARKVGWSADGALEIRTYGGPSEALTRIYRIAAPLAPPVLEGSYPPAAAPDDRCAQRTTFGGMGHYEISMRPFSDDYVSGKGDEEFVRLSAVQGSRKLFSVGDSIPWDVRDDYATTADGARLAFVANEDGADRLHVLRMPERSEWTLPALPEGRITLGCFDARGDRLSLILDTPDSPGDAYVVDLRQARAERWTRADVGGLDPARFVVPMRVSYSSFDQRRIPALFYRPDADSSKNRHRIPVVILVSSSFQAVNQGQAVYRYDPLIQYMVRELGVAVLAPNPRGTRGYGKTYASLDNGIRREDAVSDLGAALDWIGRQPELDAERVGVFGKGFHDGGYLSLRLAARYGPRLRAVASDLGYVDLARMLENAQARPGTGRYMFLEYGDPQDTKTLATLSRQAIYPNRADIRTPLLLFQSSVDDWMAPANEAEQLVRGLREQGVRVWYAGGPAGRFAPEPRYRFEAATMLLWQRYLLDRKR